MTLAHSATTPRLALSPKPLRNIIWNRLYSAQLTKRAEVRAQIESYYKMKKLGRKGVTVPDVRYVPIDSTRSVTDDLKSDWMARRKRRRNSWRPYNHSLSPGERLSL